MVRFLKYRLDLVVAGQPDCHSLSYLWGNIVHMVSYHKPNFKVIKDDLCSTEMIFEKGMTFGMESVTNSQIKPTNLYATSMTKF
jgi:hypothetical protein